MNMKLYFKHSTRCPVSAGAKMAVDGFLEQKPDNLDFELIDVHANSERSSEIAEKLGVEHESPQVILTDDRGNVLWHASHYRIKKHTIIQAIKENS